MDHEFWHTRWRENRIGFHQSATSELLERHWSEVSAAADQAVFVPMCGKSLDMLWLSRQGHPVFGVELSEIAVQAFFEENGLPAAKRSNGSLPLWQHENITIACGDFFDLRAGQIPEPDVVYDRAALAAMPPVLRAQYAAVIGRLMPSGSRMLLLTLEFPQEQVAGPPFVVTAREVAHLYQNAFEIRELGSRQAAADNPRFSKNGVKMLMEKAYCLTKK